METIYYSACPVCNSTNIHPCLSVKDYTVSGQFFEICECAKCSVRFTQNVPGPGHIGNYYQSAQYVSHTDTRQGIVNKLYHLVRRFTLTRKKRLVENITALNKGNLLDVGAGTGLFAGRMKEAGWKVTGLEPDERARQKAGESGLQLNDPSLLFTLPQNSFDVITLWHVLEHVQQLNQYFSAFSKLLKPSGSLVIAVPNYTSADAKFYGNYWAAYDVPRHFYHFSPNSMKFLLEKHGFKLKAIHPLWFDSFYVSLLSEQYKTGKTKLLKGGWIGLVSNFKAIADKNRCSSLIFVASPIDQH